MNNCVVGLQWGDEGKGKVVDILAEKADIVVRYGGGANAGHTVVTEGNKMINLLFFSIILIIALMVLGFWLNNQPVLAIDGFLMLVVGVWIFIEGFSIYRNTVTQMVGTVIFALG